MYSQMNLGNCTQLCKHHPHSLVWEPLLLLSTFSLFLAIFSGGLYIHFSLSITDIFVIVAWSRVTLYWIPFLSFSLMDCWCAVRELVSQHPKIVDFNFSADVTTCRPTHSAGVDSKNGNCHSVLLSITLVRFGASINSCPEVQCQIEMLFV